MFARILKKGMLSSLSMKKSEIPLFRNLGLLHFWLFFTALHMALSVSRQNTGKQTQFLWCQILLPLRTTVGSLAFPVRTVRSEKFAYLSEMM